MLSSLAFVVVFWSIAGWQWVLGWVAFFPLLQFLGRRKKAGWATRPALDRFHELAGTMSHRQALQEVLKLRDSLKHEAELLQRTHDHHQLNLQDAKALHEKTRELASKTSDDLQTRLNDTKAQLGSAKSEIDSFKVECERTAGELKSVLQRCDVAEKDAAEKNGDVQRLSELLREREGRIAQLDKMVSAANATAANLKAAESLVKEARGDHEDHVKTLERENEKIRRSEEKLRADLTARAEELARAKGGLGATEKGLEDAKKQLSDTTAQLKTEREATATFRKQTEELRSKVSTLEGEATRRGAAATAESVSMKSTEERLRSLTENVGALKEEKKTAEERAKRFEEGKTASDKEIGNLRREVDTLKKGQEEKSAALSSARAAADSLEVKLREASSKVAQGEELRKDRDSRGLQVVALQKELSVVKEQLEKKGADGAATSQEAAKKAAQKAAEAERERTQLSSRVLELTKSLEDTGKLLAEEQTEKKGLREEVTRLAASLDEKTRLHDDIQNRYEKLSTSLSSLRTQVEAAAGESEKREKHLRKAAEETCEEARMVLSERNERISSLEEALGTAEGENKSLKDELRIRRQLIQNLEQKSHAVVS